MRFFEKEKRGRKCKNPLIYVFSGFWFLRIVPCGTFGFSRISLLEVGTFFARGTAHQIQYFPVRLFSNIVYPFL